LIVRAGKDVENRTWPTKVRGWIAIHSSSKLEAEEVRAACDHMAGFIPKFSHRIFTAEARSYPTGAIVGVAALVGCVTSSDSPWFVGPYGFVLRQAIALPEPFPLKGQLGFWEVPQSVELRIERAISTEVAKGPFAAGQSQGALFE